MVPKVPVDREFICSFIYIYIYNIYIYIYIYFTCGLGQIGVKSPYNPVLGWLDVGH
jgi:hypothetical protein